MLWLAVAINTVVAGMLLYVFIRNYMIHKENLSLIARLDITMTEMKKLRDLLEDDSTDLLTAGDAGKEYSH
ncbi:MAG: hypothetical protein C5B60_08960 [Chloroflexi bacterium]|nr:MAG: hypothetical protein C5B60_08960 [Chloroflexota bacterium]